MKIDNIQLRNFFYILKKNFLNYFIKFILITIFSYIFVVIVNKVFIPILIGSIIEYLQSDEIKNIIIKFLEIYVELSK